MKNIQEHQILTHEFPYRPLLFPLSSSFHSAGFASHSRQKRHGKPARNKEVTLYLFRTTNISVEL